MKSKSEFILIPRELADTIGHNMMLRFGVSDTLSM